MAQAHVKDWERLLARALRLIDAAPGGVRPSGFTWSLGGGSVLMRRLRHRYSSNVDIFLTDARALAFVSPRIKEALGALSADFVDEPAAVRIYLPEGEIAFIAGALLTSDPLRRESVLGRTMLVETSGEILAKKLWHRAAVLPARDLFDFAAVAALEPNALRGLGGCLRTQRAALLHRLREHGDQLREDFAALHTWEFNPSFDECVAALRETLARSSLPPVVEEARCLYEVVSAPRARSRLGPGLRRGDGIGPRPSPG